MSRVELAGVAYAFGDVRAVDGVDLVVPQGSLTAVLGPSGCGKTTLLRLVAGLPRAAGRHHPLRRPGRRRRGLVGAAAAAPGRLRPAGGRAVPPPRRRRQHRLRAAQGRAPLATASPRCSTSSSCPRTYAERAPHELSGGQQQRVALARALAPSPTVVLLDEPFSSLDASLRVSTGRAVARALHATGTTAVLVTHDQDEALSLADQVAVMRRGRLVQADRPRDLYRAPADAEVGAFVGGARPAAQRGRRRRDLRARAAPAGRGRRRRGAGGDPARAGHHHPGAPARGSSRSVLRPRRRGPARLLPDGPPLVARVAGPGRPRARHRGRRSA